ncbi:MAG TPA: Ada metal-binding domain-containing protein [Oligoflexus sp.]|uniref:Ada metal-binding domain-containing protein n=1 Tax=Oligoflexus sp. TaxID=1971216 RepID=UPI002D25ED6A|nr:Ada metal-binding domain-containing protein [Oligoflexus sp.]HYX36147.1 Ada metal-binding domain-containing protein [Oligoflexus sp.]
MRTIDDQNYRKIIERRDPRYDGRFYWGVTTTRIYCRPICPARPKPEHICIFKSATEAEKAGYRPCLRCRPDLAPGSQRWEGTGVSVARALRLMEEGADAAVTVETLSATLGMSDRHLRRLFTEHLGASPLDIMVNRRLHLARQLIVETDRPLTEIAFASGFQSIRRFNEAFKALYQRPPSDFRRRSPPTSSPGLQLRLSVRKPYDWAHMLAFLKRHQTYGVERVDDTSYTRFIPRPERAPGHLCVTFSDQALLVAFDNINLLELRPLIARLRHLFDVDHNPSDLPHNSSLQPNGIRIPGCFDAFEVAVGIILGQLVSTTHARQLMQRLVTTYGHRLTDDEVFAFPSPELLKNTEIEAIGLTRQKAEAVRGLSRLIHEKSVVLSRMADLSATRQMLMSIPGVGPWTVDLIAMRCLGDADAFPRKDLVIQRALAAGGHEEDLWMSLRSYLTQILWRDYARSMLAKKGGKP